MLKHLGFNLGQITKQESSHVHLLCSSSSFDILSSITLCESATPDSHFVCFNSHGLGRSQSLVGSCFFFPVCLAANQHNNWSSASLHGHSGHHHRRQPPKYAHSSNDRPDQPHRASPITTTNGTDPSIIPFAERRPFKSAAGSGRRGSLPVMKPAEFTLGNRSAAESLANSEPATLRHPPPASTGSTSSAGMAAMMYAHSTHSLPRHQPQRAPAAPHQSLHRLSLNQSNKTHSLPRQTSARKYLHLTLTLKLRSSQLARSAL